MIARIKGLKISQASERTAVTGQEMIPFQDGERNGKIRMIEFKDMTMYIFDPTIVDGKVSQEDYDALKQAIEEGKLVYTINSNRNGLDLATEVAIVGGTIYIESPDFIKEEGTDNISQVVFDTITVDGSLNYSKEQYTTTVIKTTGDGTKVLTDNGQYVYIGNLALTNIKFKDGTNTSTYDLVTNGITFRQNSTPCVSWNTIKSGNNIYMDIRIANANATPKVVDIGTKLDYEHVVILLWKDNEVGTHRVDGLFYTANDSANRRQIADAHLWFSRWASSSDYSYIFNVSGQGSSFQFISCTYNGVKWWGIQHTNITSVDFYFDGTYTNTEFILVKYYNSNTSTVLNSEINNSLQNENSKVSRYNKGGDPYAYLSEVNTKVSKSGDTMTGALTINQTSSVTPLTLHGTDFSSYIQFINSGAQTAEVGYTNSLGTYLYNKKLTTHPCISLGRVDSLDEGATFYYGGTHYKLLHKGNYANELDQRYLPKTVYNYGNGCLVRLRNSASDSTMITVRIFGNSYNSTNIPFDTVIQFYNYPPENKILQATGVNNGYSFGDIKVFNYDGRIYLWFKQPQQYETFIVHAYYNGDLRNMVESISNAAMPTSGVTRTVTITPKQAIYSYDNIAVGNVTSAGVVKTPQEMVAKCFRFEKDGTNVGYVGAGSTTNKDIYIQSQNDNSIHFCVAGYSAYAGITVHTNSNVSIGGDAATEKLNVAGNITTTGKVSAANGFFKESDARLKSDIKPLDYTLDQICSIPTVSFIMNDQKQIGTIAQDLEELGFEDIVTEGDTLKTEVKNPEQFESFTKDGEEYVKVKKVEYEMLGVLAIEGVKMLKDEIEKLKAEIETLKNKQHE